MVFREARAASQRAPLERARGIQQSGLERVAFRGFQRVLAPKRARHPREHLWKERAASNRAVLERAFSGV